MTDEPENIALVYLRRLDSKLDRQADDIADIKLRMTDLARSLAERRLDLAD